MNHSYITFDKNGGMIDIEQIILLIITYLIILVGCIGTRSEKAIEIFITNLVSNDIYKNIELGDDRTHFIDNCTIVF